MQDIPGLPHISTVSTITYKYMKYFPSFLFLSNKWQHVRLEVFLYKDLRENQLFLVPEGHGYIVVIDRRHVLTSGSI